MLWTRPVGFGTLLIGLFHASFATATDHYWNVESAEFAEAARWTGDGTLPGRNDAAIVNNGGTVLITGTPSSWTLSDLRAGDAAQTLGTFHLSGGRISSLGELRLGCGANATGHFLIDGGSITQYDRVTIGGREASQSQAGHGFLTLTGGSFSHRGDAFTVGSHTDSASAHGFGRIEHSGGTLEANGEFYLGNGSAGAGTLAAEYRLAGDGVVKATDWWVIGRNGATGHLSMTGGSLTKTGTTTALILGIGETGFGSLEQSGGSLTSLNSPVWFGEKGGTGSWRLSDEAHATVGKIYLSQGARSTGTLVLDGGTLEVIHFDGALSDPASPAQSTLHLNGGRLVALENDPNFLPASLSSVPIGPAGALIDSAGHDITVEAPLSTPPGSIDGGLTKLGDGALILRGSHHYHGPTLVKEGSLVLSGTLGEAPPPPPLLHPSIGTLTCGPLTLASSAELAIDLDPISGTSDLIQVDGAADLGGARLSLHLLQAGPFLPGSQFTLLEATHFIQGDLANASSGSRIEVDGHAFLIRYHNSRSLTLTIPAGELGLQYAEWAASHLPDITRRDPLDDPDGDGLENLLEFALCQDPQSTESTTLTSRFDTVEQAYHITLPVRGNILFTGGTPLVSEVVDGFMYQIEGSSLPGGPPDLEVTEVSQPLSDFLPELPEGWIYRSFRLGDPEHPPSRGFLRIRTEIATS
ncbi:autotransporter-associated beta strand protein [Haloferula luteola]|uniref:Autotransporter-associated beta strand protein n=1 Tax=Haloferula luteola TaxID=595692 RepID=A0A840VDV0_9BACT|nr:hypothetical protein [Haloferula luteola]MBB5352808.1 autotransporter-associated beta strand protein [Haloferula luteola]